MAKSRIIDTASLVLLGLLSCSGSGATFEIVNLDPAGYGFSDDTPVAALPTNPGETLGDQRLYVLQYAMDTWGAYLHSDVVIRVEADFQAFGGSASGGMVLAGASTVTVHANFANAPVADTFYPAALADSLAGADLSPSNNDIFVTANSSLDSDPALDDWYYGLDGNAPAGTLDFHDVLLHELGHGLGFASYVDETNGRFFNAVPDIFSIHLYDTEKAEGWDTMTNIERRKSAVNDPDLVWTGTYTTVAAPRMMPVIEVTGSIAGEYAFLEALYGPSIPAYGLTGTLVVVESGSDAEACDTINNAAALDGNIAYIDRGNCNFDSKTLKAQQAGAIAVIIANNVTGGPMYMSGDDEVAGTTLTIPTVSISVEDGVTLKGESGNVSLTIGAQSSSPTGTNQGYVRMYAPNPVESGSSVSHWSTDVTPDLLMEPFINSVLREDLDLSLTLMKDIGWTVIDITLPHLTYDLWVLVAFSPGTTLTARTDDPERDGIINFEEYFFGADPEVPSLEKLPVMELGADSMELLYTRTVAPADLSYSYELSFTGLSDPADWSPLVFGKDYREEIVSGIGTTSEQVRLRVKQPATGEKVFVRLRITEDSGP